LGLGTAECKESNWRGQRPPKSGWELCRWATRNSPSNGEGIEKI